MLCTLALHLFQEDPTAAAPAAANSSALREMIHNSGPVAFAVLVILLIASIFSWAIMISKWSRFGRAHTQSLRFLRAFRKSTRLSEIAAVAEQFKPSPLVAVFSEIHDEYQRQNRGLGMPLNPTPLERARQTASTESLTASQSRLTLLRPVPSVIWEAPSLTTAGLVVAIPAVVGYNQLADRLREFAARMDDFGRELLNAIENAAMMTPPAPPQQTEEIRRRTF